MNTRNSLAPDGDPSAPASRLLARITNAIGPVGGHDDAEPSGGASAPDGSWQAALSRLALAGIERRAIERWMRGEVRKQQAIEAITQLAASHLSTGATPDELDADWITRFFDRCSGVSDPEMQALWARILAAEADRPGSFSKRMLDFVATIDAKDIRLFTALSQFVWDLGDPTPLVYDVDAEVYRQQGITFDALKHLEGLGLISFEWMSGYDKAGFGRIGQARYFGRTMSLRFEDEAGNPLNIGHVLFTPVGRELASVCPAPENPAFFAYVVEVWTGEGIEASLLEP